MGRYLVLGGAGFIGSHIADNLIRNGEKVIVLDGLLPKTGGKLENLKSFINLLDDFIEVDFNKLADKELNNLINRVDIVINSMAWTAHHGAISDPIYDLSLNQISHLRLAQALRLHPEKCCIYLGSRTQYGLVNDKVITEDLSMHPQDIQGIHKTAAESYFRVFSNLGGASSVSLRFANCFGEGQPYDGTDIGLVGSLIRDLLRGREITVYGNNRSRELVYVRDVANIVYLISKQKIIGFSAFNIGGVKISIEQLVKILIRKIGHGSYVIKKLAGDIKAIDTGSAFLCTKKLDSILGVQLATPLEDALLLTILYFKERLSNDS